MRCSRLAMLLSTCSVAFLVGGAAEAQTVSNAPEGAPATVQPEKVATSNGVAPGDIVVTAQRRSEGLSKTPVAVTVVSGETLARQAISSETDLQTLVPGLMVKAAQSSNQLNYALRGQSVEPFGSVLPGVLPYVNEVQLSGEGSNAFYDLQSIQVLKGPQGTLFGRNATGGAVLFTTAKPTSVFGGYVSGRVGNYSLRQIEGAINIPISGEKVMARLAGVYERRGAMQRNLFDGSGVGTIRRSGARASLTIAPNDVVRNETVVNYQRSGGRSMSSVLYSVIPIYQHVASAAPANLLFSPELDRIGFPPGSFALYLAAHPNADPDGLTAFLAKQKARGPYLINVDQPGHHRARQVSLSNITTFEISNTTQIKNIIGFSKLHSNDAGEFDGSPYDIDQTGEAGRDSKLRQYSEELQVIGNAFGGRLKYVAGLYYSNERNDMDSLSLAFDLSPIFPVTALRDTGINYDKVYAVYSQGTYDLSDATGIGGLSFTAGARYTIEKVGLTRNPEDLYVVAPKPGYNFALADTFKKPSWQLGLQEQVNPRLLLYAVTRRSFRSGGFNIFAPPKPGFGEIGGDEFRPQTATDVEAGAKYNGRIGTMPFRMNFAAYNLWLKDNQNVTYLNIDGAASAVTVNVPKAKVYGFELDSVITPFRRLTLGGAINYTKARFTDNLVSVLGGAPIAFGPYPDTPKWSGAVFADIRVPISDRLEGSLRGDVSSRSKTAFSSTQSTVNPGAVIPSYTTADFRAGIADTRSGWSISALLKNAFNKVYYVGGQGFESVFTLNTVVPGDRRTFFVQVRKGF